MTRRVLAACAAFLAVAGLLSCSAYDQVSPASTSKRMPADPAWQSSAPLGTWQNGGFLVYNNEWNKSEAGPQRIWANSFQHWGVESNQPNSTSVKTYPCVQLDYKNPPITSFARLSSTFSESMPASPNFDAEAAYDIWLNNYKIEIMIWVDNHGQEPAGEIVTRVALNNQQFTVWQDGRSKFSFVLSGRPETSGTVNILSFFSWLLRHHLLRPADTLTQVNFGWEIASTGGSTLAFNMQRYSLSSDPAA